MDAIIPPAVESALLADYLDPAVSLFDLAERHRLDLRTLIEWADCEATQHLLHRLKRVVDTRSAIIASHHAPGAIAVLAASAATSLAASIEAADEPRRLRSAESARIAASQLLRIAARSRKSSASDNQLSPSSSHGAEPAQHLGRHDSAWPQDHEPRLPDRGQVESGDASGPRSGPHELSHARRPQRKTARGDPRGRSRPIESPVQLTGLEVS